MRGTKQARPSTRWKRRPMHGAIVLAFGTLPLSTTAVAEVPGLGFSGQVDREIQASPPAVTPAPTPSPLPAESSQTASTLPRDGERVVVRGIRFAGNILLTDAQLRAVLPPLDPAGTAMSDLDAIAERVTQRYHDAGYPFTRAVFQPQHSEDGWLVLTIVEGRIGKVQVRDASRLRPDLANRVVVDNLCARTYPDCGGSPIADAGLQRGLLLASDLPGVTVTSAFGRGAGPGTADLGVDVAPAPRFAGRIGADNYGNPNTGRARGSVGVTLNELAGRGDRLNLDLIGSGERLWDASGDYSLLATPSGLRAGISGSHTRYRLGGAYRVLDANGLADTGSLYATYPVVRGTRGNLNVGIAYVHKSLHDDVDLTGDLARTQLDDVDLSIQGDRTDELLGGGFSQFSASWAHGVLSDHDPASIAQDQDPYSGLHARGPYDKVTFSLERQQVLHGPLSFYLGTHGQVASRNLSSAERGYLGGSEGVRAYPIGEDGGDAVALGTAELRWTTPIAWYAGVATFGAFYDAGWAKVDAHPLPASLGNTSHLSGAGLRASLARPGTFSLNLTWAYQTGSQRSASRPDTRQEVWLQGAFVF